MSRPHHPSAAPAAYRILLRLLPLRFRVRHGAELEAHFAGRVRDARRRGRLAAAAAWGAGSLDVARGALVLRVEARRRSSLTLTRTLGIFMDGLLLDLRHAVRHLRRNPGFAGVAMGTLALGIGAVTLAFTFFNGVLLRPLPYAAPDRIGILWHDLGNGAQTLPAVHPADYRDYAERSERFEAFTIASGGEVVLAPVDGSGEPELVDLATVEEGFFRFFGTEPVLGTTFAAEDDVPNGPRSIVLSYEYWQRRFGGDAGVVGASVAVNGVATPIIGVLPPDFRLELPTEAFRLRDPDIYAPAQIDYADLPPRNFTGWTVFGRLREGETWSVGQAEIETLAARLREEHAEHAAANTQARMVPLHADVVKGVRRGLSILLGAVGLVLLVAVANVAHLFMARHRRREHELALKAALGAGRWSLGRGALLEGGLLALGGGLLGTALAVAGAGVIRRLAPAGVPRLDMVQLDARVLAVVVALSVLSALIFAVGPAMVGVRGRATAALRGGARAGTDPGARRVRDLIVAGEVALCLVLLVGAGLLMRSFVALQDVRPGFEAAQRLTFRLPMRGMAYGSGAARVAFMDELQARLEAVPGVTTVTAVSQLPLDGSGPLQPFAYDDASRSNWESVTADHRIVLPGFFATMGAEVLAGREFTEADRGEGEQVIVVDDRLAELAFPGRSAVGQLLQINPDGSENRVARIVGVVRHLRLHDLAAPYLYQIYRPYGRMPFPTMAVVVETEGDPAGVSAGVRQAVRGLDPALALSDLRPMAQLVDGALAERRFLLFLMTIFGGLALVMAAVGIYGVIAYQVARRTREIGIRLALGQTPAEARRATVREGMRPVALGIVVGLVAAVVLAGVLQGLVYGIQARDPATMAAVTAALGGVALLATWLPARRVALVDPVVALRADG